MKCRGGVILARGGLAGGPARLRILARRYTSLGPFWGSLFDHDPSILQGFVRGLSKKGGQIGPSRAGLRPAVASQILKFREGGFYSCTGRIPDSRPAGQIFGSDLVIVRSISGSPFWPKPLFLQGFIWFFGKKEVKIGPSRAGLRDDIQIVLMEQCVLI